MKSFVLKGKISEVITILKWWELIELYKEGISNE